MRRFVPICAGVALIAWSVLYATFPAQSDGLVTVRESFCTFVPILVGIVLIATGIWHVILDVFRWTSAKLRRLLDRGKTKK